MDMGGDPFEVVVDCESGTEIQFTDDVIPLPRKEHVGCYDVGVLDDVERREAFVDVRLSKAIVLGIRHGDEGRACGVVPGLFLRDSLRHLLDEGDDRRAEDENYSVFVCLREKERNVFSAFGKVSPLGSDAVVLTSRVSEGSDNIPMIRSCCSSGRLSGFVSSRKLSDSSITV
jgi:hypothetical protein